MHIHKFEVLNAIWLGSVRLKMKKCKKVAIISRAIFIVVVRYLENKYGLSVWDGYILQYTKKSDTNSNSEQNYTASHEAYFSPWSFCL